MRTIDKHSPVPIYYQLQQIILEQIEGGFWPPKTRLPSERELAEQFCVSRITLRNALATLSRNGILSREMGRGTFVAEPRITQTLNVLTNFSSEMRARGLTPGARLLSVRAEKPSLEAAAKLEIRSNEPVVIIDRLRLADDEPMALETVTLFFPGCLDLIREDFSGSLYELLDKKFNVIPTRAHQQIRADFCTRPEGELLGIKTKAAVLRLSRLTFSQLDRPFEFVESVYRGDKYILDIELNSLPGAALPDGRYVSSTRA